MVKLSVAEKAEGPISHASWSPYDDNGGTCIALAGQGYCIIGASTRLSTGYSILTRNTNKMFKVNERCVCVSGGFQGDMTTLYKSLQVRNVEYAHDHKRPMSPGAVAQLLSNTLYFRRFFPYYVQAMVGGLDNEGRGAVYNYDSIGSVERVAVYCSGSGQSLIMPLLDNQIKSGSPLAVPAEVTIAEVSLAQALDLIKSAFTSATERDIYTGDTLEIVIITEEGMKTEYMDLKKD
eukprot:TRINITY_DN10266_c0_g1_i1.p2 TRINITY_DN10266_c0_g1~~TRINITY_DN10266_c0_g1_i1.p2  ORF type:complete len:235 (+),score=25.44 TRINITY_DN10266_c0_g1_i1:130-834(+)